MSAPNNEPAAAAPTSHVTEHKHGGLGELPSTAICGNDITSSCLYVSALAIIYAGRWAPLVLLMVAVLLFLFRSIYAEVVGALPLNGGAYNALLNTTTKFRASIAACLTILSYMATAVISASEAMHYFSRGDNVANLNNAMLYVRQNEHTNRIKVVTVVKDQSEVPKKMEADLEFLDDAYPEIDIEFVVIEGQFGPELIDVLSARWKIPKNFMFIGSPGDHFLYGLAELGGVRLII